MPLMNRIADPHENAKKMFLARTEEDLWAWADRESFHLGSSHTRAEKVELEPRGTRVRNRG